MFNKHRMICTDSAKTGAGARHGDSGGPLACLKNDTFVIYGVMSFQFREPCSDKMDKQAFVKVSHYIKWLRDGERGTKLQQFQTHIIIGKVNNSHYQEDLMICTGSKTRNTGARKVGSINFVIPFAYVIRSQ
ncbi:hypothetical protein D918_00327 [Trichuris suis]|nr:hypothetical protein D918_00327 [Trichuris suis]